MLPLPTTALTSVGSLLGRLWKRNQTGVPPPFVSSSSTRRSTILVITRSASHQPLHPGLGSHPTHEAARRQHKGFGTIISFDVRGDAADRRFRVHRTAAHAAVESTIERPCWCYTEPFRCGDYTAAVSVYESVKSAGNPGISLRLS